MSRKFMSFVLATALTVTGLSSAPAHAGNNDFAKALVGIAAVAMIAKAIEQENTTRRAAQAQPHHSHTYAKPQYHKPQYHKPQYHKHGHYRHNQAETYGHVVAPRPCPTGWRAPIRRPCANKSPMAAMAACCVKPGRPAAACARGHKPAPGLFPQARFAIALRQPTGIVGP